MSAYKAFQELFISPTRRECRPRSKGLTHVIDKGLPLAEAKDLMEMAGHYVDIIKLGWGTGVVSAGLEAKVDMYREYGVDICFGGTLFEIALHRGLVEEYLAFLKDVGFTLVEISDGVIPMDLPEKTRWIERLAKDFKVLSEVGSKDASVVVAPMKWVKAIQAEKQAGAWKVIAEGRESGTSGLYRGTGEIRHGLIEEIVTSIDVNEIIFECPQKEQQVWMIQEFGENVNLGNIALSEVIPVETLRQGLRADTVLSGN